MNLKKEIQQTPMSLQSSLEKFDNKQQKEKNAFIEQLIVQEAKNIHNQKLQDEKDLVTEIQQKIRDLKYIENQLTSKIDMYKTELKSLKEKKESEVIMENLKMKDEIEELPKNIYCVVFPYAVGSCYDTRQIIVAECEEDVLKYLQGKYNKGAYEVEKIDIVDIRK